MLYTSPPNGWIGYPRVSPAGDLVAFFDHPHGYGDNGTVAIIDNGGHKTTLSSGYAMSHGIAWSPTGDEVWFSAFGAGGFALRAVSLSGEHRFLWRNPGPFDLDDVSNDGRVLVTLIDVRVGAVGLTAGAAAERDLSWLGWTEASDLSADGHTLLFHEHGYRSVRQGPADLYLWRMDGTSPVRLGDGTALGLSPNGEWAASLQTTPAPTAGTGANRTGRLAAPPARRNHLLRPTRLAAGWKEDRVLGGRTRPKASLLCAGYCRRHAAGDHA